MISLLRKSVGGGETPPDAVAFACVQRIQNQHRAIQIPALQFGGRGTECISRKASFAKYPIREIPAFLFFLGRNGCKLCLKEGVAQE